MRGDEGRDGTFDTSSPKGNEKGNLKQTDKEDLSGSNNDKGNIIETSKPNQAVTVWRKRANTQTNNEEEKVVRRSTRIHCHI